MSPADYLKTYATDSRFYNGRFFSSSPIRVSKGDVVGIVLLVSGAPERHEDVFEYLYRQYMDPASNHAPGRRVFRHVVSRLLASRRTHRVKGQFDAIGGGSVLNRLTREQASALRSAVERSFTGGEGVEFRAYVASRYGHPSSRKAVQAMKADGVNKVVLVPLFPQYAGSTTGSSLADWHGLRLSGLMPDWDTTSVREFAADSGFVQAISERIDQALQRFPRTIRDDVHFLFVARGARISALRNRRDPYCCLVHHTVDSLEKVRGEQRGRSLAFLETGRPGAWLDPAAGNSIKKLVREQTRNVLVIPVDYVSEQLDTLFRLDVELRALAERKGIIHFHVTSGLNCHPLFIETLSKHVLSRLDSNGATEQTSFPGDMEIIEACPGPDSPEVNPEMATHCARCHFATSHGVIKRRRQPALL